MLIGGVTTVTMEGSAWVEDVVGIVFVVDGVELVKLVSEADNACGIRKAERYASDMTPGVVVAFIV